MTGRHKEIEHENHERWLVSYADFITLLFAFFVVMYATSTQNIEKEKKFEDSIRSEFNLNSGKNQGSGQGPGSGIAQDATGPEISPVEVFQRRHTGNQELADAVKQMVDKTMPKEDQKKFISSIRHDRMGVRISLTASAFFAVGSAKLYYPALQTLDKIAGILKLSRNSLQIEGHTDNQPINGSLDGNWELASLRATSVVRYLTKYQGIEASRLSAVSFADQKPIADNQTEEGRAKNRRVEILLVNDSKDANSNDNDAD